ncbi:MAG: DUF192 domain-containing protein [Thermoanaerobaculales bacterium]|nr:DUF192 domain-containing protein [Thermoanaerobaculales bacterium]
MRSIRRFTLTCGFLAVVATMGCGSNASETVGDVPDPERAPTVKARRLPKAVLPDGLSVTLELAISNDEIAQGLMYRSSLASDRGMLFLLRHERAPSFWMKNTLIPLDIVFLDQRGVVVDVTHDARPCKADPCPKYVSKSPATAVLELPSGTAKTHGLEEGARIEFADVPDYPKEEG